MSWAVSANCVRWSTRYAGLCPRRRDLGVFDQVFNVANLKNGVAGPTANLSIDYRHPMPLRRDLVSEGWVDRVESRKVFARGSVLFDGKVTAEATGLFIRVDRETMRRSLDGIG